MLFHTGSPVHRIRACQRSTLREPVEASGACCTSVEPGQRGRIFGVIRLNPTTHSMISMILYWLYWRHRPFNWPFYAWLSVREQLSDYRCTPSDGVSTWVVACYSLSEWRIEKGHAPLASDEVMDTGYVCVYLLVTLCMYLCVSIINYHIIYIDMLYLITCTCNMHICNPYYIYTDYIYTYYIHIYIYTYSIICVYIYMYVICAVVYYICAYSISQPTGHHQK